MTKEKHDLYCEAHNEPPVDWAERIRTASDQELYVLDAWAEDASGSWVTCACGNQCDALPRNAAGAPLDAKLSLLGLKFGDSWGDALEARWRGDDLEFSKCIENAGKILQDIEARSAQLLKEMGVVS